MQRKSFTLVTLEDSHYDPIRKLIEARFREVFDARTQRRPELALALLNGAEGGDEGVLACLTLATGREHRFFSEKYLSEPAEVALARTYSRPIDRAQVIEVGGLAASGRGGGGSLLVRHTPWFLLGLGYRYALVTATAQVRRILSGVGIEFAPIVAARVSALPEEERDLWGTYYEHDPWTGAIDLLASYNQITSRGVGGYSISEMSMTVRELKAS